MPENRIQLRRDGLNRSNPSDESEASVSVPDEMEPLRLKTAFERVEHEHAEYTRDCQYVLGVLMSKLSKTVKSTLGAKYTLLENWRKTGNLVKIWESLSQLFGMKNTVFPRILKIAAESLCILSEEEVSTFIMKKETMLQEAADLGATVEDTDYIWSLIYGLAPDQRFRLFLEPLNLITRSRCRCLTPMRHSSLS